MNSQKTNQLVIADSHKQLIKQTLMKNAHKPQTKALLDKFVAQSKGSNKGNAT